MRVLCPALTRAVPVLCLGSLLSAVLPFDAALAQAEDSAFLACAELTDRGQRIACLEDALEASNASPATPPVAVPAPAPPAAPAQPPARPPVVTAPPAAPAAETPAATAAEPGNERSLMDRLRNFGPDEPAPRVSIDDEGQDQLHDTIAALEMRRGLWIVTLSSGQVWRQEVPRTLNLREGDEITIYQAGFGNGYRLSAKRLSGFIRVERVK